MPVIIERLMILPKNVGKRKYYCALRTCSFRFNVLSFYNSAVITSDSEVIYYLGGDHFVTHPSLLVMTCTWFVCFSKAVAFSTINYQVDFDP